MQFDLHITFSGLCLFARDPGARQMHVLMPTTDVEVQGCEGMPMYCPTHIPWLLYDRQYEVGGSPGKQMEAVPLGGTSQTLGDGSSDADTQLPTEVADLGAAAGATVPAKYVHKPIVRPLATRITLNAGHLVSCNRGGHWNFGDLTDQELTPGVEWVIPDISGSTLNLATAHGPKLLNAINHAIHISIYCLPPTNLPGMENPPTPPAPDAPPPHFAAFYLLCASHGVKCPKFASRTASGGITPMGVDPYTCLLGTAPMG